MARKVYYLHNHLQQQYYQLSIFPNSLSRFSTETVAHKSRVDESQPQLTSHKSQVYNPLLAGRYYVETGDYILQQSADHHIMSEGKTVEAMEKLSIGN